MDYQSAITNAKAGTRVKRTGWTNEYIVQEGSGDSAKMVHVKTVVVKAPYTATESDIMTNDWTTA